MPTTTLNAYASAYPLVINRIRASIFKQSSPQAIIASIIDTTIGHPVRQYNFPGLPRNNYGFSLDVIDSSGNAIQNLSLFSVVPSTIDGLLTRNDEQIKCDTTIGFVSGTTTFIFDGTVGKPSYIGWDIVPSELTGRGILTKDLDYTWDKITGLFTLLQAGDVFQTSQYYNIHFEPIQNTAGNSILTINDFSSKLIIADYSILLEDFSNKIVLEPAGGYLVATLPDISTVVEGRKLMLEGSGNGCSKISTINGQSINFNRGLLFILPNESLSIYKFKRATNVFEWRVFEAYGNYKNVGQLTSDDCIESMALGKILLDGRSASTTINARLYNDFVLNLPLIQVCSFDQWSVGNNIYLYSLSDANGNFKVPDRRGLFERNSSFITKAGDYQDADTFFTYNYSSGTPLAGGQTTGLGYQAGNPNQYQFRYKQITVGTETRPVNYSTNKYVLL